MERFDDGWNQGAVYQGCITYSLETVDYVLASVLGAAFSVSSPTYPLESGVGRLDVGIEVERGGSAARQIGIPGRRCDRPAAR